MKTKLTLTQLAKIVNAEMQITMKELKSKSREQNKVFSRMLFAKIAYKNLGIPQTEISKFLNTEQPTISHYLKSVENDLIIIRHLSMKYNNILLKLTKNKSTQKKYSLFPKLCFSELGVEPTEEFKFHPSRRWRFDFAFVEEKLAIEVEGGVWTGGRHTRGAGFLKDMEKYNEATRLGWKLLRTTPNQLETKRFIDLVGSILGKKNI
ncbi:hypothetical protein JSO63_02705 [Riemerella anatipestifer]